MQWAQRHGIPVLPELPAPVCVEGDRGGDDADGAHARPNFPNPQVGWKLASSVDYSLRTATFDLECVQMGWFISNISQIKQVCTIAAQILMPSLDIKKYPFPSFTTVRDNIIKLDLLHSLSPRIFCRPLDPAYRTMQQLSPDGSPQALYDYQCFVEEVMRRPLPLVVRPDDDPFKGFSWERRSMVCQTIARKHASVAVKVNRTADAATLESGAAGLLGWRYETKGFLSDQGSSDRGIAKAPYGDPAEVMATLQQVSNKTIPVSHANVKSMTFLTPWISPGRFTSWVTLPRARSKRYLNGQTMR